MRTQVQSLALLSGLRIQRCLELWCRLVAAALIQPLAWEPPYALGAALKDTHTQKYTKVESSRLPPPAFFFFYSCTCGMEVPIPRPGVKSELQLQPISQPQQDQIQASSVTIACSNTRSLTH